MIIGGAFFILLWAAYGLFGPITRLGKSARHNALFLWMPSKARNGNYLPAVKVQEVGEWRLSKIIATIVGTSVLGLILALSPELVIAPFIVVFATVAADSFSRLFTDYAGHGAEIIEAERLGIEGYRDAEIHRMINLDSRQHMTPEQVDEALRSWHWLAKIVWRLGR